MTRDITIGGVSLNSLTNKQLEDTINECEQILVDRAMVGIKNDSSKASNIVNELLKPGLKKEMQYDFKPPKNYEDPITGRKYDNEP